jgi:FkbM family methyltransferase
MSFSALVRYLAKLPLSAMLASPELRRRLIFELEHKYYAELNVAVPLGGGMVCPVVAEDYWHSFAEIFIDGAYNSLLSHIDPPSRWIDLGCHAGYFSLLLFSLQAKRGQPKNTKALLVDGDPRVERAIRKLTTLNKLEQSLIFKQAVVAGGQGERRFVMREVMSSSISEDKNRDDKSAVAVSIVSEDDLMRLLSPPYDLIKVDIEGMEYEFLLGYKNLLSKCKHLVIEWHSWHSGGGGESQIREVAKENGFELMEELLAPHITLLNGISEQCGVYLFGRDKNASTVSGSRL